MAKYKLLIITNISVITSVRLHQNTTDIWDMVIPLKDIDLLLFALPIFILHLSNIFFPLINPIFHQFTLIEFLKIPFFLLFPNLYLTKFIANINFKTIPCNSSPKLTNFLKKEKFTRVKVIIITLPSAIKRSSLSCKAQSNFTLMNPTK